jgi:hypothetical protein
LRSTLYAALCGASLVLSAASPALAREGLERVVPASAWVFVGLDDVKGLIATWRESDHGKLILGPKFADFRTALAARVDKLRGAEGDEGGAEAMALLDLLMEHGRATTFAVLDPSNGNQEFRLDSIAFPQVLFAAELGEHAAEFEAKVLEICQKGVDAGKLVAETRDASGVSYQVFTDLDGEKRGEVSVVVEDGVFVAALTAVEDAARLPLVECVLALRGEGESLLADADSYRSSVAAEGDGGVRVYVAADQIGRQLVREARADADPEDETNAGDVLEKLGIDRFAPLGLRGRWTAEQMDIVFSLPFTAETLLGRFFERAFPPGPFALADRVTPAARGINFFHLDVAAAIEATRELLMEIEPSAVEEMDMGLAMASPPDLDLRKDLLEPLGSEIAMVMSAVEDELEALPGTEEDPTSVAVLIALDDGKTLETSLESLIRSQGLHAARTRSEFQGRAVWSIPTPLGVSVHYMIDADLLVASPSRELLNDVLRRLGDHQLPTVAADARIGGLIEAIGNAPHTAQFVADRASSIAQALSSARELLVFIDPELQQTLPEISYDELKEAIAGISVSVGRIDRNGVYGRSMDRDEND